MSNSHGNTLKLGTSHITVKTEVHDADKLCAYTTQMVHVAHLV